MKKITLSTVAIIFLALGTSTLTAGTEGSSSTYYGTGAGPSGDNGNTADIENVFVGVNAGTSQNGSGKYNTFVGFEAGTSDKNGTANTFIGDWAGYANTEGQWNTMIGTESGLNNISANGNTFVGSGTGTQNQYGKDNTFVGISAGNKTTGDDNTYIGAFAGSENITGIHNVFIGKYAGNQSKNGGNIYIGSSSGGLNTNGSYNTFLGSWAGLNNITGQENTFLGNQTGYNADINNSVLIGNKAGYNATRDNTLYISNSETNTPLIYGEFDTGLVRVNGAMEAVFNGDNTTGDGLSSLATLSANNSASGKVSDAGFRLENTKEGFQWDFRTLETYQGFAATKVGTGGAEFRVDNTTSDYHNAKVSMGGVVVFENGQLQTPSSRVLKTNIKPLDTKAAIEAFHQLQPVSYAYKAHKEEPVVGFIAEDVPELVATKTRTGIDSTEIVAVLTKVVQEQDKKIFQLEAAQSEMQILKKRLSTMESLLTNLALNIKQPEKKKLSVK